MEEKENSFIGKYMLIGIATVIICLIIFFFCSMLSGEFKEPTFVPSLMIIIAVTIVLITISVIVYICNYIYRLGNKINEPKGLLYLSFFIPVVGLILYCVYIRSSEKLGKNCGKLALIGISIPIILTIIFIAFVVLSSFLSISINLNYKV